MPHSIVQDTKYHLKRHLHIYLCLEACPKSMAGTPTGPVLCYPKSSSSFSRRWESAYKHELIDVHREQRWSIDSGLPHLDNAGELA